VWWRAAQGEFVNTRASMFQIADGEASPLDIDPEIEVPPDLGLLRRPAPRARTSMQNVLRGS
jgi:hypothetical protein